MDKSWHFIAVPQKESLKQNLSYPIGALLLNVATVELNSTPIHYVPTNSSHYWAVDLLKLEIGSRRICCDANRPSKLVFDTGTTLNGLPADVYKSALAVFQSLRENVRLNGQSAVPQESVKDLKLNTLKPPNEHSINDSDLDLWPNITYTLVSQRPSPSKMVATQADGVEIILTPQMYMINTEQGRLKPGFVEIDIQADSADHFILGILYFRHFYTIFVKSNLTAIGFAQSKPYAEVINLLRQVQEIV